MRGSAVSPEFHIETKFFLDINSEIQTAVSINITAFKQAKCWNDREKYRIYLWYIFSDNMIEMKKTQEVDDPAVAAPGENCTGKTQFL